MKEFPSFALLTGKPEENLTEEQKINRGSKVRYIGHGKYYRDAGDWTVHTMWKDDRLICSDRKGPMAHCYGDELIECTLLEYAEDNRGYVPTSIIAGYSQNRYKMGLYYDDSTTEYGSKL